MSTQRREHTRHMCLAAETFEIKSAVKLAVRILWQSRHLNKITRVKTFEYEQKQAVGKIGATS